MLDCTFLFLYDGLWLKWPFTLKNMSKNNWVGWEMNKGWGVWIKMSWVEKNWKINNHGRGRLLGTREYLMPVHKWTERNVGQWKTTCASFINTWSFMSSLDNHQLKIHQLLFNIWMCIIIYIMYIHVLNSKQTKNTL